ncbi:MAG: hypothetical protein J0L75_08650 [Spirochaetes bacterium]|nr:hypothetical protein [Spirochaetota bacterium]
MKRDPSLEEVLGEMRRRDAGAEIPAQRLLAQFHDRLQAAAPARRRPALAWFLAPAAVLGLLAAIAFLAVQPRGGSQPLVRVVAAPKFSLGEIKIKTAYQFNQDTRIEGVSGHEIRVAPGTTLALTSKTPASTSWDLRQGRVDVVHRATTLFSNTFTAGPWVVRELGTTYHLLRDPSSLEVAVLEGRIGARNAETGEAFVITNHETRRIPLLAPEPALRIAPAAPHSGEPLSLANLIAGSDFHARSPSYLHRVLAGRYQRYTLSRAELRVERPIELPATTRGLLASDDRLWALTTSEYLYTWDASGARKTVRTGPISGANLYAVGERWVAVNTEGEVLEYDADIELRRRAKALSASLWEGVALRDRYLVLPDLSGHLVCLDLQGDLAPKSVPLAGQVCAPLTLVDGGVRAALDSGAVVVGFQALGIPSSR